MPNSLELADLELPALIKTSYGFGRTKSAREWNYTRAEPIIEGELDSWIFFDSSGRELTFDAIVLRDPVGLRPIFASILNFVERSPKGSAAITSCRLEGSLELVANHDVDQLKLRLRMLVDENPRLRCEHTDQNVHDEVNALLASAKTAKEVVRDFPGLYDKASAIARERSSMVSDFRKRKRLY